MPTSRSARVAACRGRSTPRCCAPPTDGCTRVRPPRGRRSSTWSRRSERRGPRSTRSPPTRSTRRRPRGCSPPRQCARDRPRPIPCPTLRDESISGASVVLFGTAWATPLVGRMLAASGAHVVKVEHPAPPRSVPAARRPGRRSGGGCARPRRSPPTATASPGWSRAPTSSSRGIRHACSPTPASSRPPPRRCCGSPHSSPPTVPGTARPPRRTEVGRRATIRPDSAARRSPIRSRACWAPSPPSTS